MEVKDIAIEKVIPYARNPRRNDAAVAAVAASIREFGFRQPIVVDEDMTVLVGHTRLKAAQALGLAKVPVHIAKGLTESQRKAYRIADNKLNDLAVWDDEMLALELVDLQNESYDLTLTGLNEDELEKLLNPSSILPGTDLDDAPATPKVAITKPGDLITLGRHRLICGDSTDTVAWETLLDGRQVGMVWTDPPYGVSYVGKTKDALTIENDTLAPAELEQFLRAALSLAWAFCKPGAAWYVAAPAGPLFLAFATVLTELRVWRQTLVWVKSSLVLGRSDYHYRHESIFEGQREGIEETDPLAETVLENTPIISGWHNGAAHTWNGGRKQDTVLEFPKPSASRLHPTMKPVALVQKCIENSSNASNLVVDPFGGSGTAMIAAEACGRASALIELSPAYCDVIVTRWETATGQKAVRP